MGVNKLGYPQLVTPGYFQRHWTILTTEISNTQFVEAHQFGTIKVTHNERKLHPEERKRY